MARSLENKENVEPVDSDYPYGRIKDNTGSDNGTPINEDVYGDFHQFFARMFAESGLTYNELPDNDYSGFQYYEALKTLVGNIFNIEWVDIAGTVGFQNGWLNHGFPYQSARYRIEGKYLVLSGEIVGTTSNNVAFALPVAPIQIYNCVVASGTTPVYVCVLVVSTIGEVTVYNTGGGATLVSLDGVRIPLD